MDYSYAYILICMVIMFMGINTVNKKPVWEVNIEPIVASIMSGGLCYYYFNVYLKQNTLVEVPNVPNKPINVSPIPINPVTNGGDLERINNQPFPTK